MPASISFDILADYIRRNPITWRGVGLLYLRPFPENITATSDEQMIIRDELGAGVVIGACPIDYTAPQNLTMACYIADIASDWQLAVQILENKPQNVIPANTPLEAAKKENLTILIVEDDALTSKLITHHLQKFGKVITTKNAHEATANANVSAPDIVFLDIHYKDDLYDGFDVLRNIISSDVKASVVMFSADHNPQTIIKALAMGAKGFISKPFHASDFVHYMK